MWKATLAISCGAIGTVWLALNFSTSKYAYIALFISSILWIEHGYRERDQPVVVMNTFYFFINLIGIICWVLRP